MLAEAKYIEPDALQNELVRWIDDESDLADVPLKLAGLARYWFGCRTDGGIPARTAIDPAELKPMLPNILMFGLERTDNILTAVRIRLMGTGLVRVYGRDWTGLTTSQFDREDQVADHLTRMQTISERGQPLYWRHGSLARGCEDLVAEHIFCPLTDAAGEVSSIISLLDFPGMENDPRVRDNFGPLLLPRA